MRSGPIVVIAESMMTGTTIMRVAAGDTGARVLDIGEEEVEALDGGGTAVLLEMAVRRGAPELSSGTGRRKSKILETRLRLRTSTTVTVGISIKSRNSNLQMRDIDLFLLLWFVFSPFCLAIHLDIGRIFYSRVDPPV